MITRMMTGAESPVRVFTAISEGKVRRLAVIVMNARSDHPNFRAKDCGGSALTGAPFASLAPSSVGCGSSHLVCSP